MKLNRALAEKNRLARKIKDLQSKITSHNSYIKGNQPVYDITGLIGELEKTIAEIVDIKVKIATANLEVVNQVYRLSELKSYAGFLKGLTIKEGKVQEEKWNSDVHEWESTMGNKVRDTIVESKEIEIENIQTEMDRFNFETEI